MLTRDCRCMAFSDATLNVCNRTLKTGDLRDTSIAARLALSAPYVSLCICVRRCDCKRTHGDKCNCGEADHRLLLHFQFLAKFRHDFVNPSDLLIARL